jgi:hypothetical protein
MTTERKTVRVKIVAGYVPDAIGSRRGYLARIFAAFWSLAK